MTRVAVARITYGAIKSFREEDCFGRRCNVSSTASLKDRAAVPPLNYRVKALYSVEWITGPTHANRPAIEDSFGTLALGTYREVRRRGELWPILSVRVLGRMSSIRCLARGNFVLPHVRYDTHSYTRVLTYVRVIQRIHGFERILCHWLSFEVPKERWEEGGGG